VMANIVNLNLFRSKMLKIWPVHGMPSYYLPSACLNCGPASRIVVRQRS
jgi:hypothetical protein